MTVGEALTEARSQAGLTVDELSQRTRIRESVIRSIEQDDYEACGGDLYVRGYVRAIAGAVGIDAQPLIREYDMLRAGAANGTSAPGRPAPRGIFEGPDATMLDLPPASAQQPGAAAGGLAQAPAQDQGAAAVDQPPAAIAEADPTMLDLPPVAAADPAETKFDLPPVTGDDPPGSSVDQMLSADPAATRYDLPLVTDPKPLANGDLMAAGYEFPPAGGAASGASPAQPWPAPPWAAPSRPASPWDAASVTGAMQGPPGARHGAGGGRHFPALAAVAIAVVLAAAGLLVVHLSSGGTASGKLAVAPKPHASSAARAPSAKANAKTAQPTAEPTTQPAAAVTSLHIAAAKAFGPDGLADGDNPQIASNAIARKASVPWSTQWYLSADFGRLKQGTGLLLDLGHPVTIISVRVDLSRFRGANVQLKTGDGTAPGDLKTVATVTGTGGVLRVTLPQPTTARYLLVWFTLLPPNGQGQFQESISGVEVNGRA